jgi:hypothetical protein
MPITPEYISSYIQKLFTTNPESLYERYGFPVNKKPELSFFAVFDNNFGWRVEHRDNNTQQLYFSELVQPPKEPLSRTIPLLDYEPQDLPIPPFESETSLAFTLIIENVGLPTGAVATTKVLVFDSSDNVISSISVPFSSRLDLPLSKNGSILSYSIKTTSVPLESGEYFSSIAAPIKPAKNKLIKQTIVWTNGSSIGEVIPIETILPPKQNHIFTYTTTDPIKPSIVLSTLPPRIKELPLSPPSYDVIRLQPPENSFVASSIEEMISFKSDSEDFEFSYEIGSSIFPKSIRYKIRNNTVTNSIMIKMRYPEFLTIDVNNPIILSPQNDIIITFSMNFDEIQSKSILKEKSFSKNVTWSIEPIDVTGPVYIKRNLPPVTV